ncbi:MAG TPA: stage II sporulation protein M [Dissulfurispiraceae bacterium]|nr:stage II sporulation protein M [Dissulfurispiraceae bacterium]
MIVNLHKFISEEGRYWMELEAELEKLENDPERRMSIDEVKHLHYLYQRTASALARISAYSSEPEIRRRLESLTARAYAEINETRKRPHRFRPVHWFFTVFPLAFRRRMHAFYLSLAITVAGMLIGGFVVALDPEAKQVILPFPHLKGSPAERVASEEKIMEDRLQGVKMRGASWYMTHNTQVCIFTMALGISWGVGTVLMLFYNGVILGAVVLDYALAGKALFLVAWLSPHGAVEIPAILLAGQTGLILAGALIGRGNSTPLNERLREVSGDIVTLIFGVALMLVWAGFIESFVSQYHEPVLPYALKTGFGVVEIILLILFFALSGRDRNKDKGAA